MRDRVMRALLKMVKPDIAALQRDMHSPALSGPTGIAVSIPIL
jgi:hypothetical protein